MPLHYRCPLCLQKLGSGHRLVVFQSGDPTARRNWRRQRIDCAQKNFIQDILTFGGQDATNPGSDGVFVSHSQCKALNPFWDSATKQINIPGDQMTGGDGIIAEFQCLKTTILLRKNLSHWVIGMLRNTYKFSSSHSPMWYPFPLLRATATEDDDDLSRPFGSLVEMASTQDVGKTILTLQLLNEELYRNSRILDVADFFFPRGNFLEELYFRCMWREGPVSRPLGTKPTPGDMRALFVKPVPRPLETAPSNGSRRNRRLRAVSDSAWEGFKYFLYETFKLRKVGQPEINLEKQLKGQDGEFWNPVIFYDTAGEQQNYFPEQIKAVRQITNKIAICIDAREIFDLTFKRVGPRERNRSIKHACSRISGMELRPHRKRKACVVITRLDEIPMSAQQRAHVSRIAEDLDIENDAARNQLVEWLNASSDSDKVKLVDYLQRDHKTIDQVFFVWTENLPKMTGIRYSPIKDFDPPMGESGTIITLTANPGFNFTEAKKVLFNNEESEFEIISESVIKATVPTGATSGFIGIILKGVDQGGNPITDEAASEKVFELRSEKGTDAAKPQSFGLVKFLAWCLDKRVEEIARVRGYSTSQTKENSPV